MKLIFALILTAQAGVLSTLCDRCLGAIVKDDPHQFEEVSISFVIKSAEALVTASRWRELNAHERSMLKILVGEIKQRAQLGPFDEREAADMALIRFGTVD